MLIELHDAVWLCIERINGGTVLRMSCNVFYEQRPTAYEVRSCPTEFEFSGAVESDVDSNIAEGEWVSDGALLSSGNQVVPLVIGEFVSVRLDLVTTEGRKASIEADKVTIGIIEPGEFVEIWDGPLSR